LTEKRDFYEIQRDTIKPHPCCCFSQACTACELGRQHDFKAEDIELIQTHMRSSGPSLTGGKFYIGENPQTNAQFSSAYVTALGVLRGRMGLKEIDSDQVRADTEVAELAGRVVMAPIEEMPPPAGQDKSLMPWRPYDDRYQGVKVVTKDGKVYTCFRTFRELIGPETTLAIDFVRSKFHECAEFSGLYSAEESDAIMDGIMELDQSSSIAPLVQSLCVDAVD
jgi:2-methylcitrate dehydratase PrpD